MTSSMELTVDRAGAATRRIAAMAGHSRETGQDLAEYPPAVFVEGGAGATVRGIPSHENRSFGAYLMWQLREVKDGMKVTLEVVA